METEEINKGNKLIAEFMMGKYIRDEDLSFEPKGRWYGIQGQLDARQDYHLKYCTSWDWLMPVVEKIENMTIDHVYINVLLGSHSCVINPNVHPEQMFVEAGAIKIEATWRTIVKFIKWYNEK